MNYKATYRDTNHYLDLEPGEYTVTKGKVFFCLPRELDPDEKIGLTWIPVDGTRGWVLHSENPITVTPSIWINQNKMNPTCGEWHGFLTNGEFVTC